MDYSSTGPGSQSYPAPAGTAAYGGAYAHAGPSASPYPAPSPALGTGPGGALDARAGSHYVPIVVGSDGQAYIHLSQLPGGAGHDPPPMSDILEGRAGRFGFGAQSEYPRGPDGRPTSPLAPAGASPAHGAWAAQYSAAGQHFFTVESLQGNPGYGGYPGYAEYAPGPGYGGLPAYTHPATVLGPRPYVPPQRGSGGVRFGGPPGGGRPAGPPAEKHPPVKLFCKVCQVRLPETDMRTHKVGKKHARAVQRQQEEQSARAAAKGSAAPPAACAQPDSAAQSQASAGPGNPKVGKAEFRARACPVCPGVLLASEGAMTSHMAGKKHAAQVAARAARGAGGVPPVIGPSAAPGAEGNAGSAAAPAAADAPGAAGEEAAAGDAAGSAPAVPSPGPPSFWKSLQSIQKRRREEAAQEGGSAKRAFVRRECDVCGVMLESEPVFLAHATGRRHLAALEALAAGKSPEEAKLAALKAKRKKTEEGAGQEEVTGSAALADEAPAAEGSVSREGAAEQTAQTSGADPLGTQPVAVVESDA